MDNLTDVYNQFASIDEQLEKQASEMVKQAEEEEFAGRIMARGFADEMNKLAQWGQGGPQAARVSGQINQPRTNPRGTQMAEAPKQPAKTKTLNFTKNQGSTVTGDRSRAVAGQAAARGRGRAAANIISGGAGGTPPPVRVAGTNR